MSSTYFMNFRKEKKMRIVKTITENGKVKSLIAKCGENTVEISFSEDVKENVMKNVKELIMSAYDLRKQKEEKGN